MPRGKFRDIVSVLAISVIAVVVVFFIASWAYNLGYHNGVDTMMQYFQSQTDSSSKDQSFLQ